MGKQTVSGLIVLLDDWQPPDLQLGALSGLCVGCLVCWKEAVMLLLCEPSMHCFGVLLVV